MKIKLLLCVVALSISCASVAESVTSSKNAELKTFNNVRVSMQRMLRSNEGRYFLNLNAGVWNPHGTLYDLVENKSINLKGLQKGDQLNLTSVASESNDADNTVYQLIGTLNANTGNMSALLSKNKETFGQSIQFQPSVNITDKPVFVFKFYGLDDSTQASGKILQRVDVINKTTNKVVQSLTGFNAFSNSMGYMDINFDGYYDVILSDVSNGLKVEDKHFIYWMYNPKTQQFQRSPQLDKIVGFPSLHGEKQQIDFGNGQLYQVEKGLLKKINYQ